MMCIHRQAYEIIRLCREDLFHADARDVHRLHDSGAGLWKGQTHGLEAFGLLENSHEDKGLDGAYKSKFYDRMSLAHDAQLGIWYQ